MKNITQNSQLHQHPELSDIPELSDEELLLIVGGVVGLHGYSGVNNLVSAAYIPKQLIAELEETVI